MLTALCAEINNYFIKDMSAIHLGEYSISNGTITGVSSPFDFLKIGQYFRIVGSDLNDGVYLFNGEKLDLKDEDFNGAIWAMSVPPILVALAAEIEKWRAENESVNSANMSPYNSESFDGYSYSKGGNSKGGTATSWQAQFAPKLNPFRRLYVL